MLGDNNSLTFIQNLLQQGIRIDGREAFQSRLISIEFMDNYGRAIIT